MLRGCNQVVDSNRIGDAPKQAKNAQHEFALARGTTLGEFEISSLLGSGAFSMVYKAVDTTSRTEVVVKEFFPTNLSIRDPDGFVRPKVYCNEDFETVEKAFLEEGKLLARLRHDNIMPLRTRLDTSGTHYIIFEHIAGETLDEIIEKRCLSEGELRQLLLGLLDGLDAVHKAGAIHRDVKPSNILVRSDGTPVLFDFGAACYLSTLDTSAITAMVTTGYSPPEQYGTSGTLGAWTDFYALGATAYRCVTGDTPSESWLRLRQDPLKPTITAAEGYSDAGLLRAIDWILKINGKERPGRAWI
jgi:serine/threonine protein kinase